METASARWGTWEELVLGGAVLRHGTGAWEAVASELRSRTPFPALFTPQECQAKYEDLQQRYSGYDSWFDELRKCRVAELKEELEKSEDSIGSLQSKLEILNAKRPSSGNSEYSTNQTESPLPSENATAFDSCNKALFKDRSSAGSFVEGTCGDCSQECQISTSVSSQVKDAKILESFEKWKAENGPFGFLIGCLKKKRGKRKRKGESVMEENMDDTCLPSSAASICSQDVGIHHKESCGSMDTRKDLASILNSIMEQKDVSIFQHRLESQKRARYKKMIRRHVDFQSLSLRIDNGSILSAKELCRDLLLLSNNALVFYPENCLEQKAALIVRDLVIKTLRQSSREYNASSSDGSSPIPVELNRSKKLSGTPACDPSIHQNLGNARKKALAPCVGNVQKGLDSEKPIGGFMVRKRGTVRLEKGGRSQGNLKVTPYNGRKKVHRKL